MELNEIILDRENLASLFGQNLVVIPDTNSNAQFSVTEDTKTKHDPSGEVNKGWKSLGNNQAQILILVNEPEAVFLPDKEMGFLTDILSACHRSMADVAIVNLFHYPETSYKELLPAFQSRIVMLFEIAPGNIGLPIKFPMYQLQAFSGCTFLYAPSLKTVSGDRLEKSKLWVSLKRLFNL